MQTVHADAFQQITAGAVFQGTEHKLIVIKSSQDNDFDVRVLFLHHLRAVDAIHLGHSDVHQDKVRTAFLDAFQHFKSISYGRDNFKIRFGR